MSSHSSHQDSVVPHEPKYPFDAELSQSLWPDCLSFAMDDDHKVGISQTQPRVEPLHIALVLLFNDLTDSGDTRLFGETPKPTPERPLSLERSLFWIAISIVSKSALDKTLTKHIENTTYSNNDDPTPPMAIGLAFWTRLKESVEPELPQVDKIDESNVFVSLISV